ncbi:pectate lyase family protein [Flavobacterium flavipallidum]|uniref:T9SS type A sorting domain-containing protein n=1 Tax=Flavobacterium flavipallidum TaxID=3139140 RepID=A0ABU9HIH9_9FLAO
MKKILLYLTILFASLQMCAQTVTITESVGWLESAYVKWQPVSGAQSYNVYYSGNSITNQKIDNQLIRSYGTYFRADLLGLAAGTYTVTVKPVVSGVEGAGATTSSLTVLAHDRNGFAFQGGRIPGGYNMDGTPKANAVIVYVTENTKNTVSLNVTGATTNPCVGIQNILYGFKKGMDNRPLIVRLIGNVTDMSVMDGGDMVIENKNNASGSITIEGVGNDAVCNGWGVRLKSASNIEVRNLATMNVNSTAGDNIGMQQDNDHIWIHNNDLFYGNAGSDADQIKGDGALDNKTSTYCTFSYNHFWDNGKASLLGLSENTTTGLYVTYHHNWFDHSDSRHPRVRFYSAHIYNNYYDGIAKYGAGSTMGSSLFVEGNYYRNAKHPMMISLQGTDVWSSSKQANDPANMGTFSGEDGGMIKAFNNTFDADLGTNDMRFVAYGDTNSLYNISGKISSTIDFDAYVAATRGEQVPNTVKSFAGANVYNNFDTDASLYVKNLVTDAPAAAKAKVMQYAGRVGGGDFKWTFNNSADDSAYLIIDALKSAVTNYVTSLVAVQGETVVSSQTLTSTSNTNQTVNTGSAIANIVYTWGGDATDATVSGLPASGITFVKDATAKTITVSGTPTANVSFSITTSGVNGNPAIGSGNITVVTPGTSSGGEIHNFTVSGKTSSFYTIVGNMNSTDGVQSYDGVDLTARLKIESATTISYTTTGVSTLTLVFDPTFAGAIKLNGTSYTASSGIVSIPNLAAGSYTITKGDTANLYYIKTAYATSSLITPTLSNFTVPNKTVGDAAFTLTAPTSNSSGAFTYTSSNTSVATVSGNTVTIVGEGIATITANQAATSTYAAGSISATLSVAPGAANPAPSLSNFTIPNKTVGDAAFTITAPTSNSTGAFTYTSSNTAVATVSGNTVTVVGAGTATITANQAATSNYAAGSIAVGFTVTAATAGKTEVWDFAAEQLDTSIYNNKLDVSTINGWYPVTTVAGSISTTNTMPTSFTVGALSWVGNTSDRLRTTNTSITRYDENIAGVTGYSGRVYCNGTSTLSSGVPTNRFMRIALDKDDEVTIITRTDADATLSFVDEANPTTQTETLSVLSANPTTTAVFVAKNTSTFKIYSNGKTSFFRILRKAASASTVSLTAPTLSNFSVANKKVGDAAFALTAPTSTSDGVFSYTSSNTSVATISGNTVTIVGAGTTTITANQAVTATYASGSIAATLTVTTPLTTPTLSNFTIPNKTVGDAAFALTAPVSNSDGAFTYTSSNTAVATINGNTVTIVGEGSATITANQAATASYTAGSITADLTVAAAPVTSSVIYDFRDGVIIAAGKSADNVVTLSGGNYKLHGATYGLNMKVDGQIDIAVTGSCTVRFLGSQYSSLQMEGTATSTGDLGTKATKVVVDRVDTFEFAYIGGPRTLRFKLVAPGTDLYLPLLEIIPNNVTIAKADVWDFGGVQLDEVLYNNKLDVNTINAWYSSTITAGSSGIVLPSSFTAGDLGWVGGTNDRLRTSNTAITRYDTNIGSGAAAGFTGRIYVNGTAQTGRYLSFNLKEDDELTVFANSDAAGKLNFVFVSDANVQSDLVATTTTTTEYKFVAKKTGLYKIFDPVNKPSYYRVYRKPATYVAVSGTIDITKAADIPAGYTVDLTNQSGKTWSATVSNGKYNAIVPAGYTYTLSVGNANGYLITSGDTFAVTVDAKVNNIAIAKITLYTVTGNVTGLGTDITKLSLKYTPNPAANSAYIPAPTINTTTTQYSVKLEAGVAYTISGIGVNEYEVLANSITANANATADVAFTLKPKYKVTITAPTLDATQLSKLGLKFTNTNEAGVSYTFTDISNINLRNGTYSVAAIGLDEYPLELALTSNLVVSNAAVSKELTFKTVTNWSFDDKVITSATTSYKGMLFTGSVANEIAKGHLNASASSTLSVPVQPNQKVTVTYYYAANFSIAGGTAVTTSSNSTTLLEKVEYVYTGTVPGNVVIAVNGTTYFTDVNVDVIVPYAPVITVGIDKDYQTINAALKAISKMVRTSSQRVTVVIDPGNYEEMIVVNSPNVTFKNASSTPSIALKNKGVDIDANAVRITSYYGYGYSYYSQGNDNKWNAEVLAVNKANNSYTYENVSGTTNGSYWDATAVIAANGFEAENIIFENSFNQYISKKESQDKAVMWAVGNKGLRPTDYGNTAVQNRSFVERAAAIGIPNGVDKTILKNCRVVGRQDSFYGGQGSRVAIYKGVMMGAVDYIFGGMTAVFYKTDFAMNVSDVAGDAAYLTAPQQSSGRGYLLYECKVTSAEPGVETASAYRAKPGYFGRPWAANTSEVVVYKATIETSNYTGSEGLSLIAPEGWTNSLSGTSDNIYEFGTIEKSGVNNAGSRASWTKVITTPVLTDGTEIKPFNFTKGADGWDPFPILETITSLPNNNFTVKVNSATCNGMQNGSITVASNEQTLNYTVSINATYVTLDTASGYSKTIDNLAAGVYNVCFSTPSIPGFSQCFEVKIEEPEKINISSFVSKNANTVKLIMTGASTYKVTINGLEEIVTASEYSAKLTSGLNTISVSTDLVCQGTFDETIFLSEDVQYFPNPTTGTLNVYLAGDDSQLTVRVFDMAGNKLYDGVKSIEENRNIGLDLTSYVSGVYMVQLEGKTISKTFKIVKK